jgi:hypothetical protein
MKKNDIVTVMTSIGEYIAKLEVIDETGVHVKNPRLIVQSPEGEIGFGRGVSMSAIENTPDLCFRDCIFVAPANEGFQKAWIEATSGIIV